MIHKDFKSDDNSLNVKYKDLNLCITHQFSKRDHEFKRHMLQRIINVKLNRMNNETEHDAVIKMFCSYFQRIKMKKTFNMKDQEFFQRIKIELSVNILEHDVSAVVCMLINFNTTMLKKFKEDHTIIQKVVKVENVEIFIAMTHSNDSMHMFNDDEQLRSTKENIKNNYFMHYINRDLFEHLIMLEYSHMLLTEQYRAIFIINDIVFTVWYKAQMQFSVDSSLWLNMIIAIIVLKSFCEIKQSLTFLNVNEINIKVDASQFKQNEIEVIVAIELVKIYAEVEISIKNIIILTEYTAQVQLLKRSLVSDLKVQNVEAYMIDSFQDKEASVIILCMMKIKKLDFMSQFNHLLTVCSCACNSFVVLCNYDEFQHDYACNLHMIRHVQNLFSINEVYEKYFSQQEFIDFMKIKHQFWEQKSQWNENEAWYASEDQAINFSEEQKHYQNMSEN